MNTIGWLFAYLLMSALILISIYRATSAYDEDYDLLDPPGCATCEICGTKRDCGDMREVGNDVWVCDTINTDCLYVWETRFVEDN